MSLSHVQCILSGKRTPPLAMMSTYQDKLFPIIPESHMGTFFLPLLFPGSRLLSVPNAFRKQSLSKAETRIIVKAEGEARVFTLISWLIVQAELPGGV